MPVELGEAAQLRRHSNNSPIATHPAGGDKKEDQLEAYCLKCRVKREMKDPKPITMKNGKPATEGSCPVCSTRMFKIGKA